MARLWATKLFKLLKTSVESPISGAWIHPSYKEDMEKSLKLRQIRSRSEEKMVQITELV